MILFKIGCLGDEKPCTVRPLHLDTPVFQTAFLLPLSISRLSYQCVYRPELQCLPFAECGRAAALLSLFSSLSPLCSLSIKPSPQPSFLRWVFTLNLNKKDTNYSGTFKRRPLIRERRAFSLQGKVDIMKNEWFHPPGPCGIPSNSFKNIHTSLTYLRITKSAVSS